MYKPSMLIILFHPDIVTKVASLSNHIYIQREINPFITNLAKGSYES